jgi:hypothetical protein
VHRVEGEDLRAVLLLRYGVYLMPDVRVRSGALGLALARGEEARMIGGREGMEGVGFDDEDPRFGGKAGDVGAGVIPTPNEHDYDGTGCDGKGLVAALPG